LARRSIYLPTNYQIVSEHEEFEKHLVHTIYWQQRIGHKKDPWDFVPLSSKILYSRCHDYRRVIEKLIEHQVIEVDDAYEEGVKCKSFRMASRLWDAKFKRVLVNQPKRKRVRFSAPVLKVLAHWFRQLKVDDDLGEFTLMAIADKDFWFKPDQYGRVHTNLTNLKSEYRSRLRVNGKPLVSFDLVNSQPYFLGLLICQSFCSSVFDKSSFSSFFLNSLYSESNLDQSYIQPPPSFHYVQPAVDQSEWKRLFTRANHDPERVAGLRDYLDLVCKGKLYDELSQHCPSRNRKQLKERLFRTVFFGKTIQSSFQERFPLVSEFIRLFKKKDHRHLAQTLQRLESKVVIHQICNAVHEADPNIPILTIHDSILTTIDHADSLESVLKIELDKLILKPSYRKESYAEDLGDEQHLPIIVPVTDQSLAHLVADRTEQLLNAKSLI